MTASRRIPPLLRVLLAAAALTLAPLARATPPSSAASAASASLAASNMPAPAASTIVIRSFRSHALHRDWSYVVYLPPGYRRDDPRHPVLYLLHGNGANALDWVTRGHLQTTADALIERHEIPPVVIVMPQGGTDWYVDRKEKMQTALLDDLLPDVEAHFAVSRERAGRAIGGVSMGGFGALRLALLAPQRFCGAMLLSPAIYSNEPPPGSAARYVGVFGEPRFDPAIWHALNYPALWPSYFAQPSRVPMFIAAGDDDLAIQAEAGLLYTRLRHAQNPAALRIVGGAHTWDVWRRLIGAGLSYTLECVR